MLKENKILMNVLNITYKPSNRVPGFSGSILFVHMLDFVVYMPTTPERHTSYIDKLSFSSLAN